MIELTRDDLLSNVTVTVTKLEELKNTEEKIARMYKEPVSNLQKKMIATAVNVSWILVFTVMAFNFVGYHLLLMPILYWIFRGSKVSDRISKSLYKNQLDENEKMIDELYQRRAEIESEIKGISLFVNELRDIAMLKEFEHYIKTKQANTIQKCIELYKKELSK